jgi:hypothetical protein
MARKPIYQEPIFEVITALLQSKNYSNPRLLDEDEILRKVKILRPDLNIKIGHVRTALPRYGYNNRSDILSSTGKTPSQLIDEARQYYLEKNYHENESGLQKHIKEIYGVEVHLETIRNHIKRNTKSSQVKKAPTIIPSEKLLAPLKDMRQPIVTIPSGTAPSINQLDELIEQQRKNLERLEKAKNAGLTPEDIKALASNF